ncbi:MAG: hypothetical protein IPO49_01605 [Bacteroidetes bacterium]|nr:hypothetical protein [Bacteroidota bacterium]
MAALDNISYFVATLRSNEFEGFRSEIYIPSGCFIDKGNQRVSADQLKSEYYDKLKPQSSAKGEIPGLEKICKTNPTRTWKPIGKSGFTIAAGFDVSRHGINDLRKFKFNQGLEIKLLPFTADYSGPAPGQRPSFTSGELKEIDFKVVSTKLPRLVERFDSLSSKSKFDDLNVMFQTVLYSIFHQYQNHFFSESYEVNKVWKKATAGDWAGVQEELSKIRTFSTRRKKEAELIELGLGLITTPASPKGDFVAAKNPVV